MIPMRVLIVASYNKNRFAPFIQEQADALAKAGCEIGYFGIQGKGVLGYLKQLSKLKKKIKEFQPDIIHAHYGLSGLLANLQRQVPVVTTYHGSDINNTNARRFSKIAMRLSAYNVFVSQKTLEMAKPKRNFVLLPCGINLEDYPIVDKLDARKQMGLDMQKKYVLFAGAFDNAVKNAPLAQQAVALLFDVELLELKGYSRQQVALLMQAVDCFLMTSFTEGSPQVIKEAMACGCPIVSVDVGDVKERIMGLKGCFIVSDYSAESAAKGLTEALNFDERTGGRNQLIADGLSNDAVASKLLQIYECLF